MKITMIALAASLVASTATAGPVTLGQWSAVPLPTNTSLPWFNSVSWDCHECGVAWLMQGNDYLHAPGDPNVPVAFTVPYAVSLTDLGGTSDYLPDHLFDHILANGEMRLNSGHGYTASSLDPYGAVLFRKLSANRTDYWVWFEDLDRSRTDADYQDHGYRWSESVPVEPPPTVPEPGTLLLFGTGALVLARRMRKATA